MHQMNTALIISGIKQSIKTLTPRIQHAAAVTHSKINNILAVTEQTYHVSRRRAVELWGMGIASARNLTREDFLLGLVILNIIILIYVLLGLYTLYKKIGATRKDLWRFEVKTSADVSDIKEMILEFSQGLVTIDQTLQRSSFTNNHFYTEIREVVDSGSRATVKYNKIRDIIYPDKVLKVEDNGSDDDY